jgi:hypothetical protein
MRTSFISDSETNAPEADQQEQGTRVRQERERDREGRSSAFRTKMRPGVKLFKMMKFRDTAAASPPLGDSALREPSPNASRCHPIAGCSAPVHHTRGRGIPDAT